MTNKEAIEMLKSKMDGQTDTSWEWTETVRLAINALMHEETAQTTEAFNVGFEAGCEEERKKFIDAMHTMNTKITELEDKLEIKCKNNICIDDVIEDILSHKDEPACKEIRENCVMINFLANRMQDKKPYYSILYYDKRDGYYYDGFGSYNHHIVNAYKEAYFNHWDKNYFEKKIEELEDKHWEECRQIALYEDEVKRLTLNLSDTDSRYKK